VSSIQKQNLPLAKFIRKDIKPFDPAKPLVYESFYWPASRLNPALSPD